MRDFLGAFDLALYRIFDLELRVPQALRSPYRGGVVILGMLLGFRGKVLLIAMITVLVYMLGPLQGPLVFLLLTAVAIAAGAVAGAVYGLLHPLARAGDFGVWFRWAVTLYVYFAAITVMLPRGPFSLEDPAFHWIATLVSILTAFGIVLTDDRGASRLSPRNFRLLQNRILLRAAPRRMWYATQRKRARYEARRKALEREAGRRPEAWGALRLLLTNLKTDLLHVRGGLERARQSHAEGKADLLADVDAWIERINRQLEALPTDATEIASPPPAARNDPGPYGTGPAPPPAARN
jgi:hypothetical protein